MTAFRYVLPLAGAGPKPFVFLIYRSEYECQMKVWRFIYQEYFNTHTSLKLYRAKKKPPVDVTEAYQGTIFSISSQIDKIFVLCSIVDGGSHIWTFGHSII